LRFGPAVGPRLRGPEFAAHLRVPPRKIKGAGIGTWPPAD